VTVVGLYEYGAQVMMSGRVQINLVTSSGPTRIVNGVAPGLRGKKFRRLGHDTT